MTDMQLADSPTFQALEGRVAAVERGGVWVIPTIGNDANVGSRAAPLATMEFAFSRVGFGESIKTLPNTIIREDFDYLGFAPMQDGVNLITVGGGRTFWPSMDRVTGAWTANGASYFHDITHAWGGTGGVKIGGTRLYPGLLWRTGPGKPWQQLYPYTASDFASDAAAIADIQGNGGVSGRMYVQDLGGNGCGLVAGWLKGSFRYHIRLPGGLDPNTCQFLVKQRLIPFFGHYHLISGHTFFGTVEHDGLVARSSHLQDVEVAYTASHASEITGCSSESLVIRDGNIRWVGYALHQYSTEVDWPKQVRAHHRRTKVINWGGDIFGAHGVSGLDGGGGAGAVSGMVEMDEPYFENCANMGSGGGLTSGFVLRQPTFLNSNCSWPGWNNDVLVIEPRMISGPQKKDDYVAGAINTSVFGTPAAGFTITIIGGSSHCTAGEFFRANGGALVIKNHLGIFDGGFCYNTGAHQGVTIENCTLQCNYATDGGMGGNAFIINPIAGGPVNIKGSHLAGVQDLTGQAGVTFDEGTIFGGDAGLRPTRDVNMPVAVDRHSTAWSVGERHVSAALGCGRNIVLCTNRGLYAVTGGFGQTDTSTPQITFASTFTARGAAGFWPTNNKLYAYGLAGAVLYAPYFADTTMSALASGVAYNFVAHLVTGANLFLLSDAGKIVKIDTATNAFTDIASPVAWRARGGVDAGGGNLLIYGSSDDGTAGGVAYSTDSGATWTSLAGVTSTKIRCGALVNGIICLLGLDGTFLTGTTVNGAFTQRDYASTNGFLACSVDAASKKLAFVTTSRFRSFANRLTRHTSTGVIDCNNANPATWAIKTLPKPLPSVANCLLNPNGYDGITMNEMVWFGPGVSAAVAELIDGMDYWYIDPKRNLSYNKRLTNVEDQMNYFQTT